MVIGRKRRRNAYLGLGEEGGNREKGGEAVESATSRKLSSKGKNRKIKLHFIL
jgi:hypothetical protein